MLCHWGSLAAINWAEKEQKETEVRLQNQAGCFCPEEMAFLSHSTYYLTMKQVCAGSNFIKA